MGRYLKEVKDKFRKKISKYLIAGISKYLFTCIEKATLSLSHWGSQSKKKKKKIDLTSYTKVKSKRTKDLTVRPRSIKPLEENIDRTLFDINLSKIFFDTPPRVMKIKTKINKWDLIKLKSFCIAKETINNTRRQHSEWEKMFANKVMNKGLISQIYKQLMQLHIKNQVTQSKKWAEDQNRHFCKEDIQMATKRVQHH